MNNIKLFNDLPRNDNLKIFLYNNKETLWLNELWWRINEIKNTNYQSTDLFNELEITLDYLKPLLVAWILKIAVSDLVVKKSIDIKITKNTLNYLLSLENYTDKEKRWFINNAKIILDIEKLTNDELNNFINDESIIIECYKRKNSKVYTKNTTIEWLKRIKEIWKTLKNNDEREQFEMFNVEVTIPENNFLYNVNN